VADFYVWVTATTNASADGLVAALVRENFSVKPLSLTGRLTMDGELSAVISLRLAKEITGADQVLTVVKKAYEKMNATHHSVVVLHIGGSCQWTGSNIKAPPAPPSPTAKTAYERLNEDDQDEK
jgi:hypothetical protein